MGATLRTVTLASVLALSCAGPAAGQQSATAGSEPYVDRMRKQGRVLELALRDAIEMALKQNLDIAVQNYNTDLSRLRLWGARGFYDPTFSFSAGANSSTTPTTSVLQAATGSGSDSAANSIPTQVTGASQFASTFLQNIPGGGAFNASFTNARNTSNDAFSLVNPLFGTGLNISFTQALWRGFRRTSIRHQLRILSLDSKISDSQFRQTVSEILLRVHNQYWNLVFALESYESHRQSRDLALVQQENTGQRVQSGLLTPVALTSAKAEVAIREQDMIQAEVQIINAENALKRLLAPDPRSPVWTGGILPADRPGMQEIGVTLDQAIEAALKARQELEQIDLQLQQNDADRVYFKNAARPSLSLNTNFGSIGRAGEVFAPVFDSGGLVPSSRVALEDNPAFGGYLTSWRQMLGFDFPNWGVNVSLEVPIRNRSLRAQVQESGVQRLQLESRVKGTQQDIIVEVRNAFETVQLQRKALEAARLGRELSEEQLNGETARFAVGFTTTFEVLRYQRDLSDAKVRELRALIDYQLAVSSLRKAMDQIADANDIVIARHK